MDSTDKLYSVSVSIVRQNGLPEFRLHVGRQLLGMLRDWRTPIGSVRLYEKLISRAFVGSMRGIDG